MPDIRSSFERFFSSASVKESPITLTITDVKSEEIKRDDGPAETKWVAYFDEDPRGLVINKGRFSDLNDMFGPNTDDWIGQKIALVYDKKIKFKGQTIGGVAVSQVK